jgi:hypothetical protein
VPKPSADGLELLSQGLDIGRLISARRLETAFDLFLPLIEKGGLKAD